MNYPMLLSPFNLNGKAILKNRVIMAPMNTNYANSDGSISKQFADYYVERAKGGTALLIVSPGYVDRRARKRVGSILLDNKSFVPALHEFTDRVHEEGALILQQLNHNGRLLTSTKDFNTAGGICVGPSAIPHAITGEIPHVLSIDEIKSLVSLFTENAINAELAGYDGIEVHGAHGYLINQFISRYSNKREDEYGGSFENRIRFPLEIIQNIRKEVKPDFIISFRLGAEEFNQGGIEITQAIALAKKLEDAGVDLLNVTAGNTESTITALRMFPPPSAQRGCYSSYARQIKWAVKIPVSVTGRIATPERAEEMLECGDSDLITLGRSLICDPFFVAKSQSGHRKEIRQCIGCSMGCYEMLAKELPLTCIYNPFVGKEGQIIKKADKRKKVWVIGAGPGGMEAARVAALRGHDVALFDAKRDLGGQLQYVQLPPGKAEFGQIIRYYRNILAKLGIKIFLNITVTTEKILSENPDAIVFATGSEPIIPRLPGLDQENVFTSREALSGQMVGENVLVAGGGLVGIETALYLWKNRRNVIVIEMLDKILVDAGPLTGANLLSELSKTNIEVHTKTKLLKVEGEKIFTDSSEGDKVFIADSVVLAIGAKPNKGLKDELEKTEYGGDTYLVGDCVEARRIQQATAEGAQIAMGI